jgi:DNA-binding NtrC family response regulator
VYTLLVGPTHELPPIRERLAAWSGNLGQVMELERDSVAAQLLRSDAPPHLVIRVGAAHLDTSLILDAAAECGRELPPVVVLCDKEGERLVRMIGDPSIHPLARTAEAPALFALLDRLLRTDSGEIGLRFDASSPMPPLHFGVFVGESAAMQRVYRALEKVARSDTTCLVGGESGTGKELAASVVHQLSKRSAGPLVPVNCGAIPENLMESEFFGHKKGSFTGAVADHKGRFQAADGGTLFLDEIGEMIPALQVKLLRALQSQEVTPVGAAKAEKVDVRVVAATNRDLLAETKDGRFREDLYYRLSVVPIRLPSLRERREDIPMLVRVLVDRVHRRTDRPVKAMTRAALECLCAWDWPGNVRQLAATLERMVVMADGDVLGVTDVPPELRGLPEESEAATTSSGLDLPEGGLDLARAVEDYENRLILQALERTAWNKSQAAQLLQMNRTTLVEKLKKRDLKTPEGLPSTD